MRIALFAAILLAVVSVPAAYAGTLQLVTENGNVFSIDFDEILRIWDGYNPSNQTLAIKALELRIDQLVNSTVTNSTSQQDVIDLQNQVTALIAQLNATRTNSTATDASVAIIQGQINALVGQLNTVLTNSTATEAEIDALQDQINTLTTEVENLEQDGIGAGALGTSGRMVSAALDGYVIYGEHGQLGTISEATTYNRYTGPVDYIGIIPDKDYFTKYSLDSPNGQYYVSDSELVPVHGSSKLVRTDGHKVLEGSAPVIQDRGREVEIDVNGKVLVQLDESRLGNGVTVGVDTEGVTAQVVTSQNDLINTEYRDFNGTGKFVLFEGEAQYGPLELQRFYSGYTCRDDYQRPDRTCRSDDAYPNGLTYNVRYYNTNRGYDLYNSYIDTQRAIPSVLDVYVSNVDEVFDDSDTTLRVKYGYKWVSDVMRTGVAFFDGIYAVNSTLADGLWHMTGFMEEELYSVTRAPAGLGGQGPASATGYVAAHGTQRVTDTVPYVIQGVVEPFSSESIPTVTNSNVYVLLEGIGNDQTYTVSGIVEDGTPPTVLAIERHNPSSVVTDSDTLVYKVTFSEDVIGVDAGDFVLTPDSTSGMNVSLATYQGPSVYFTSHRFGGASSTVTVTEDSTDMWVAVEVDFPHRQTRLSLTAPNGNTQSVPYGENTAHLLNFGSGSSMGDWRLFASPSSHGEGRVYWSLTVLTGNATSPVTAVSGSGSEYYVTVPASRAGTYGIGLGSNPNIADAAGNLLSDRVPTLNVGSLYVVAGITDVTAPVVTSIERSNPTAQNTNSQTLTYKVTFSEDVTGVDAFDFVFSPDSTGGGTSGSYPVTSISGSGDTYHVTVPADTDGTYNLDLVSSRHGIADMAGNPLTDTVPVTGIDHTYVSIAGRDNTRPTVSSIDRHDPPNQYTDSKTLTYKVTFSEDVTGVDEDDFVLFSGSTGKALLTPPNQLMQTSSPALDILYQTTVSDTITVSDSGTIATVVVAVDITHPSTRHLKVDLVAPDGTVSTLHDRANLGSDLLQTYMLDGTGMQMAGNWVLQAYSYGNYGRDTVDAWGLTINHGSNRELGPVASLSGSGDTYYATVFATQNGTYNLDLASSGHGIEDTAGNGLTDTSIATGTARISANGIVGAGDVQINGLPGGVPWVFETVGGPQLHSGLTTPSGSITMPLQDYSVEGVAGEFSLLVYEDGFGQNVRPGDMVADLLNKEFFRHNLESTPQSVIYIPERYMLYPITVPVTIDDVRLGKLTTDCNVTDQLRIPYINGSYEAGFFVVCAVYSGNVSAEIFHRWRACMRQVCRRVAAGANSHV